MHVLSPNHNIAGKLKKVGQTTTSQLASFTKGFNSLTKFTASSIVLFIFQFPAIIAFLMINPPINNFATHL